MKKKPTHLVLRLTLGGGTLMAPSGGEQGPCRHLNTVARVKNLLGSRRYSSWFDPPATSGVARVSETCRAVLVPYRVTFMIIFSSSSEMCIYESPWYPVNPSVRCTGGSAEQWLVRPRTWSLWRKSRSRKCARAGCQENHKRIPEFEEIRSQRRARPRSG